MLGGIKNIHCRRISSSMLCQLCISRHWRLQIMTLAPDLAFAFLWGRMSVSGSADTAEQRGKPEQSRCFTGSGNTLYRWLTPTIHPHTHTHFQFSLNPPIKHQIQDLFCCEVDHNRIPVRHNTWSTSSILYAAKGNLRLVNDVNCSYVSLSAGSSVLKTALCCQL